ncbi:NADPH:quinone oxidoreductase family protein [Planococcus sp. NCCP-2050]|uniref:NADPH:quinone oxidoreductase family protein n=1 Tax=Planococcus sp. NCCP-2050 TaxID=2944679 RepID=UPI00203D7EA9|nr:NADPH:quinone oxidoreductase family protein [Planococcus sp. NCCP-2050]GKW45643.1 oxidoreductase [Planococcus sp. NCCP-2050]
MKTWSVTKLADPQEALELVEKPKPEPGPGEVLVKVEAAALNFFDILQCQGKYQEKPPLPFTPGAEIGGIIEAAGEGADFKIGQRVLATPLLPNGGLAEWTCVKSEGIFPIPDSLSFPEAAAMFITYQTAYFALHRTARLQPGEVLLVHAGSGGVGSAAIQLGKAAGAIVIATAGSDEKTEICKQLGADQVINYRTEDFVSIVKEATNGKGANVIFDPVGGDTFDRSRKCIAFEGRLLVIGFAGGRIADAPTNHALIKNYSIVGVHFGLFRNLMPKEVMKAHLELMDLFEQGAIKPLIYEELPFEQVPDALDLLGDRKTYGKLVVIP